MRTVNQSWEILIEWFTEQKPELLQHLNKGATEAEILELEAHIGKALPDELRDSLLRYNGTQRIFLYDGYDVARLLPVAEIKAEYDYRNRYADELAEEAAEAEDNQRFAPQIDIPVLWFSTGDHSLINHETGELFFRPYRK